MEPEIVSVEIDEYEDMVVVGSAPIPVYEIHVPVESREGVASEYMADLLEMYGISSSTTKYGDRPTIYMVPMELKWGDDIKCYDPVAVKIGLCRRRSTVYTEELQSYKSCCVRQLISQRRLLVRCFETMKCLYPKIQACYSKRFAVGDEMNVARTMLLDGCFILHRLLKYARFAGKREANCSEGGDDDDHPDDDCFVLHRLLKYARLAGKREAQGGKGSDDDDHPDDTDDWTQVVGRCCVWQLVTRDLLLLENQIPFFVLLELFGLLKNDQPQDTLVKGSLMLFRSLCPQMLRRTDTVSVSAIVPSGVHHLLHLFYLLVGFEPTGENEGHDSRRQVDVLPSELPQWIPGAKELEEAGIRFRKRKNAKTFLDIKFDFQSGVLEIPPLQLYDYSDALFRNLIAFEQTYPGTRFDISTYSVFMNCLINTPEDMRILHLRGILVNMMNGEQDASHFFNRICSQVHFPSKNYLVKLMGEVSKYKDSRRHKWRAALVRDYFSNPWVAISVVAAVLLLGMTVVQTFFTVYPYFKPRN